LCFERGVAARGGDGGDQEGQEVKMNAGGISEKMDDNVENDGCQGVDEQTTWLRLL
jgi:hypothetical protein